MKYFIKKSNLFITEYVENEYVQYIGKNGELKNDISVEKIEYAKLGKVLSLVGSFSLFTLLVIIVLGVI